MDKELGIDKHARRKILRMGDLSFQGIIGKKYHGISKIMEAYSGLVKLFPTPVETKDNSWFCQPLINNSNLAVKLNNRHSRGFKLLPITPDRLDIPQRTTINLNELYEGGRFLEDEDLETLIRRNSNDDYVLGPNTAISLKNMMKYVLGIGTHYDGVKKIFPNTVPVLDARPPKYSSSNIENLMSKIKRGSKNFRKVLTRHQDFITTARLNSWKTTLDNDELDKETLRKCFKLIHNKDFTSDQKDTMISVLTRKRLFNNQHKYLYPAGMVRPAWAEEDFCWDCRMETGEENEENLLHALWSCPQKADVRGAVQLTFKIVPPNQPVTTHILWDYFVRMHDNHSAVALGNFINWHINFQILLM
jgi:hypothetical protein